MFDPKTILAQFGFKAIQPGACSGEGRWGDVADREVFDAVNPADETVTAKLAAASARDYETLIRASLAAHETWRTVPAPRRGELVARIGALIAEHQEGVAAMVALDTGKSLMEARGE